MPQRRVDLYWLVGGPQGRGVETAAMIFLRSVAAAGYYAYGRREYWSNIAGRHSYFLGRISDVPVWSVKSKVQILMSIDGQTVIEHVRDVAPGGLVIYNKDEENRQFESYTMFSKKTMARLTKHFKEEGVETTVKGAVELYKRNGARALGVSYNELLRKVGERIGIRDLITLGRFVSTLSVALGAAALGLPKEALRAGVEFSLGKRPNIVQQNMEVVNVAYEAVENVFNLGAAGAERGKAILWNGNEAVAVGKIMGGIRFVSFYPITPAADEALFIESRPSVELDPSLEEARLVDRLGVITIQAEDELAAVNAASGAAIAGLRASTTTSGPGFSLMAEGISFMGMAEVGVVITLWMRGGPSTGLPTRTSQADLRFALHTGHGEFPRIVLASGDVEEAFYDAIKTANWAERYQVPVIHLLDKNLASSYMVMPLPRYDDIRVEAAPAEVYSEPLLVPRYDYPLGGLPRRIVFGVSNAYIHLAGNEHDEYGDVDEDAELARTMQEKRLKKLELIDREIPDEEKVRIYGNQNSDVAVVSWGSTKRAILDALDELGEDLMFVQLRMFQPFPATPVREALRRVRKVIFVENNYMAQGASVLREKTGVEPDTVIVKYNGRPFTVDELAQLIDSALRTGERRIVAYGEL